MVQELELRAEVRRTRPSRALALLLALCAASFGAIVQVAWASHHFHTTCVLHGFVHGESTSDGSFFSRVENGCGGGTRRCAIYNRGSFVGSLTVGGSSTCNAWSRSYGSYTEYASSAHVYYAGAFSDHTHLAANWCG